MPKAPNTVPLTEATKLAETIAKTVKGGEIFALSGDLGAGKTTFTKALGRALGVKQTIPSPTFVMMQEFSTSKPKKLTLYHLDLYRTNSFKEVEGLGITQWWGRPETITVIEWADKIADHLPKNAIRIKFIRDVKAN